MNIGKTYRRKREVADVTYVAKEGLWY